MGPDTPLCKKDLGFRANAKKTPKTSFFLSTTKQSTAGANTGDSTDNDDDPQSGQSLQPQGEEESQYPPAPKNWI